MHVWFSGKTSAFQAEVEGSTPSMCSIYGTVNGSNSTGKYIIGCDMVKIQTAIPRWFSKLYQKQAWGGPQHHRMSQVRRETCSNGEIGRRSGLKIRGLGVRVQVPL